MRNYQTLHLDTNWSKERHHCCSHFTSAAVCHLYWLVCGVSTRKHNGSELFLQEQSSLYPASHYDVSNTNYNNNRRSMIYCLIQINNVRLDYLDDIKLVILFSPQWDLNPYRWLELQPQFAGIMTTPDWPHTFHSTKQLYFIGHITFGRNRIRNHVYIWAKKKVTFGERHVCYLCSPYL